MGEGELPMGNASLLALKFYALYISALMMIFFPNFSFSNDKAQIKHLRCVFDKGVSASNMNSKKIIISSNEEPMVLIFDGISLGKGKARLVGNQGAEDVQVASTLKGLTFTEKTKSGNITITTVNIDSGKSDGLAAVHSRHLFIDGAAMHSQYYGECKNLY